MTRTTETVIDQCIRIFDRAAHDSGALERFRSVFAPDATMQLRDGQEPVTGVAAIMEVYQVIARDMADSKHFWTTTVLDDGTLECRRVQAPRAADGRLVAQSASSTQPSTPTA
jgi:hypothetical protein